jgi:hypothetical protein
MEILILVCALSLSPPDCQRATAQHIFYAMPNSTGMAGCLRDGLFYAAQSRLVGPGSYTKIFCRYGQRISHNAQRGPLQSR